MPPPNIEITVEPRKVSETALAIRGASIDLISVKVTSDELWLKESLKQLQTLAKGAPGLAALLAHRPSDQKSLDELTEHIRRADAWEGAVDSILDKIRDALFKAHKTAVAAQTEFKATVVEPLANAKKARAAFLADVLERQRQDQLKKDADQRALNEKEAAKATKVAERAGADPAAKEAIRQEILSRPAPVAQAAVTKPQGVSVRYNYSVRIVNFSLLLRTAAQDKTLLAMLMVPAVRKTLESALRGMAVSQKDAFQLAGCELVKNPVDSDRGAF